MSCQDQATTSTPNNAARKLPFLNSLNTNTVGQKRPCIAEGRMARSSTAFLEKEADTLELRPCCPARTLARLQRKTVAAIRG